MELMCSKIEMDDHNIKSNIMMVKIYDINHYNYKIWLEKMNIFFFCTSTKIKTVNISKSYSINYYFIFLY